MDKNSRLTKWALKQQKKLEISEGMSTGFKHRAAYHREFTGFSEIRTPSEKGRFKIERVYVAPWYRHNIPDRSWKLMKILFAVGDAVAIALFIIASVQGTIWNYSPVTAVMQALASVIYVILSVRIGFFIGAPRNMTIGQCNGIDVPLKRWALFAFLISVLMVLWNVILLISTGFQDFSAQCSTLFMLIPGVGIFLAIWLVQSRMIFIPVENSNTVDDAAESYIIK